MSKKGVSNVITTIMIVLLGLVAISVVWAIVKNLFSDTEDDISIRGSKVNLKIKDATYSDGKIQVKVERGIGEGDLVGLRFAISDGTNAEVIKKTNISLGELETKIYNLSHFGIIKEITVNPIVKSSSGKTGIGTLYGKKEFTNEEIIMNLGGISWWRFEGNERDVFGKNHGINHNATLTTGKFGQAYNFNSAEWALTENSHFINLSNMDIFSDEMSISLWAYPINKETQDRFVSKGIDPVSQNHWWMVGISIDGDYLRFRLKTDPGGITSEHNANTGLIKNNEWMFVTAVYNGSNMLLYKDGVEVGNWLKTGVVSTNSSIPAWIGASPNGNYAYRPFNGTLDEIIIYNRGLSSEEITDLYNYEF